MCKANTLRHQVQLTEKSYYWQARKLNIQTDATASKPSSLLTGRVDICRPFRMLWLILVNVAYNMTAIQAPLTRFASLGKLEHVHESTSSSEDEERYVRSGKSNLKEAHSRYNSHFQTNVAHFSQILSKGNILRRLPESSQQLAQSLKYFNYQFARHSAAKNWGLAHICQDRMRFLLEGCQRGWLYQHQQIRKGHQDKLPPLEHVLQVNKMFQAKELSEEELQWNYKLRLVGLQKNELDMKVNPDSPYLTYNELHQKANLLVQLAKDFQDNRSLQTVQKLRQIVLPLSQLSILRLEALTGIKLKSFKWREIAKTKPNIDIKAIDEIISTLERFGVPIGSSQQHSSEMQNEGTVTRQKPTVQTYVRLFELFLQMSKETISELNEHPNIALNQVLTKVVQTMEKLKRRRWEQKVKQDQNIKEILNEGKEFYKGIIDNGEVLGLFGLQIGQMAQHSYDELDYQIKVLELIPRMFYMNSGKRQQEMMSLTNRNSKLNYILKDAYQQGLFLFQQLQILGSPLSDNIWMPKFMEDQTTFLHLAIRLMRRASFPGLQGYLAITAFRSLFMDSNEKGTVVNNDRLQLFKKTFGYNLEDFIQEQAGHKKMEARITKKRRIDLYSSKYAVPSDLARLPFFLNLLQSIRSQIQPVSLLALKQLREFIPGNKDLLNNFLGGMTITYESKDGIQTQTGKEVIDFFIEQIAPPTPMETKISEVGLEMGRVYIRLSQRLGRKIRTMTQEETMSQRKVTPRKGLLNLSQDKSDRFYLNFMNLKPEPFSQMKGEQRQMMKAILEISPQLIKMFHSMTLEQHDVFNEHPVCEALTEVFSKVFDMESVFHDSILATLLIVDYHSVKDEIRSVNDAKKILTLIKFLNDVRKENWPEIETVLEDSETLDSSYNTPQLPTVRKPLQEGDQQVKQPIQRSQDEEARTRPKRISLEFIYRRTLVLLTNSPYASFLDQDMTAVRQLVMAKNEFHRYVLRQLESNERSRLSSVSTPLLTPTPSYFTPGYQFDYQEKPIDIFSALREVHRRLKSFSNPLFNDEEVKFIDTLKYLSKAPFSGSNSIKSASTSPHQSSVAQLDFSTISLEQDGQLEFKMLVEQYLYLLLHNLRTFSYSEKLNKNTRLKKAKVYLQGVWKDDSEHSKKDFTQLEQESLIKRKNLVDRSETKERLLTLIPTLLKSPLADKILKSINLDRSQLQNIKKIVQKEDYKKLLELDFHRNGFEFTKVLNRCLQNQKSATTFSNLLQTANDIKIRLRRQYCERLGFSYEGLFNNLEISSGVRDQDQDMEREQPSQSSTPDSKKNTFNSVQDRLIKSLIKKASHQELSQNLDRLHKMLDSGSIIVMVDKQPRVRYLNTFQRDILAFLRNTQDQPIIVKQRCLILYYFYIYLNQAIQYKNYEMFNHYLLTMHESHFEFLERTTHYDLKTVLKSLEENTFQLDEETEWTNMGKDTFVSIFMRKSMQSESGSFIAKLLKVSERDWEKKPEIVCTFRDFQKIRNSLDRALSDEQKEVLSSQPPRRPLFSSTASQAEQSPSPVKTKHKKDIVRSLRLRQYILLCETVGISSEKIFLDLMLQQKDATNKALIRYDTSRSTRLSPQEAQVKRARKTALNELLSAISKEIGAALKQTKFDDEKRDLSDKERKLFTAVQRRRDGSSQDTRTSSATPEGLQDSTSAMSIAERSHRRTPNTASSPATTQETVKWLSKHKISRADDASYSAEIQSIIPKRSLTIQEITKKVKELKQQKSLGQSGSIRRAISQDLQTAEAFQPRGLSRFPINLSGSSGNQLDSTKPDSPVMSFRQRTQSLSLLHKNSGSGQASKPNVALKSDLERQFLVKLAELSLDKERPIMHPSSDPPDGTVLTEMADTERRRKTVVVERVSQTYSPRLSQQSSIETPTDSVYAFSEGHSQPETPFLQTIQQSEGEEQYSDAEEKDIEEGYITPVNTPHTPH